MVERSGGKDGRRRDCRKQNDLFYADDIMVASSDPEWLWGSFSTLVRLFDWVGLRKWEDGQNGLPSL